jgi:hypothetical protein
MFAVNGFSDEIKYCHADELNLYTNKLKRKKKQKKQ